MVAALYFFAALSLILTGAIFGFFFAWVCSAMWGFDAANPKIAIAAMQAVNGAVQNAVFFPAFFGPPVVLLITAILAYKTQSGQAALSFGTAGLVYLLGGLLLTVAINVPMNQQLAKVVIPDDMVLAIKIWQDYSAPWQFWNLMRCIMSGLALALTGLGIFLLGAANAVK